jgi:hypothetical protein
MFGFSKKKSAFEQQVISDGIEHASTRVAQEILTKIGSYEVALQFVLEEIEAASQGNKKALDFVKNSGFSESEYSGAMNNSFDEVDGPGGPQLMLLNFVTQISDIDLMVSLRVAAVDKIMQTWQLGRYS